MIFNIKRYLKNSFFRNITTNIKIKKKFSDLFKNAKLNKNKKNIILLEFNNWTFNHIAAAYICDILSKKQQAKIKGYPGYQLIQSNLKQSYLNKFLWKLGNKASLKSFGIFKSLGIEDVLWPKVDLESEESALKEIKKYNKKIKSKEDVQNYKINNILIGDLIYDSFLKKTLSATIDIKSPEFKNFFFDSLKLFFIWKRYFNKNKVTAVVGYHAVYLGAIPLRLAIYKKIPCYSFNIEKLYRLDKRRYFYNLEYLDYKKKFKEFSRDKKKIFLKIAKEKLTSRFNGLLNSDLIYTSESAYGKKSNKKVLRKSKNLKILIAPSSVSDSPHFLGNTFFPDLHEWLECLGKISNQSKYDWYIKCHPDYTTYFDKTVYYIKKFTKKYPKIKLLNSKTSHNQIIGEGINYVLTINGTIAGEYPFYNINVINASSYHSHVEYNFSITPKNRSEYIKVLKSLKRPSKTAIKQAEVLEHYYMKYQYFNNNWFFNDLNVIKNSVKGFQNVVKYEMYEYWLNNFDLNNHKKKYLEIKKFIDSKEYVLRR